MKYKNLTTSAVSPNLITVPILPLCEIANSTVFYDKDVHVHKCNKCNDTFWVVSFSIVPARGTLFGILRILYLR
jgi:hypothetical protein